MVAAGLDFLPVAHETTGAMGPAARDRVFLPLIARLKADEGLRQNALARLDIESVAANSMRPGGRARCKLAAATKRELDGPPRTLRERPTPRIKKTLRREGQTNPPKAQSRSARTENSSKSRPALCLQFAYCLHSRLTVGEQTLAPALFG